MQHLSWTLQPSSSSELSPAIMSPSARRIFAAQRERLLRPNLLDLDGRAWTTNYHQDQATLFPRNEAAARTPPQVSRESQLMSDKHKLKPIKHKINFLLNRIAAILTAAGPRMRAGTWPPTELEKAPLVLVLHCWGIWISHDAVRLSHEAVTRLRRVVRRRTRMDGQGNVACSDRVVSG